MLQPVDTDSPRLQTQLALAQAGMLVCLHADQQCELVQAYHRRPRRDLSRLQLKDRPDTLGQLHFWSRSQLLYNLQQGWQVVAFCPSAKPQPKAKPPLQPVTIATLPDFPQRFAEKDWLEPKRSIIEVQQRALTLLAQQGLRHWHLRLDRASLRFGLCNYRDQCIQLNYNHALYASDEAIEDTLLHEIAHALCPGQGHNARWRDCLIQLGGQPRSRGHAELDELLAQMTDRPRQWLLGSLDVPSQQFYLLKVCPRQPKRNPEQLRWRLAERASWPLQYFDCVSVVKAYWQGRLELRL